MRGNSPRSASKPDKPNLFDHSSDAKLTDELGKIYDRTESREERAPQMPARDNGERLADRVERSYEWLNIKIEHVADQLQHNETLH